MSLAIQNANRFRELLLDGNWVAGTNFKALLIGINKEQATTRIANLNTIAALTFHIHYYISGVLNVLEGGALTIRDKYSFDLPPITSEEDWQKLLATLWLDAERFGKLLEQMPEERLTEVFVDEKYGNYQRNIDGLIEHSYYHLGQLVLLQKLLLTTDKSDLK